MLCLSENEVKAVGKIQPGTLVHGNCLSVMPYIPDGLVDAIIADLPYGTTACKWDTVIPFEPLWEQYKRLIKPRGAIVLFGSQPFTSALVMSNLGWFKYCWVWDKKRKTGHLNAKKMPLRAHEDILVFGDSLPRYYPVGLMKTWSVTNRPKGSNGDNYGENSAPSSIAEYTGYPESILRIAAKTGQHPTQKPVALLEYLIRTYTNEGETVLDNAMGSGSTGVAAVRTNRSFIGIELLPEYYAIAEKRVAKAQAEMVQESFA